MIEGPFLLSTGQQTFSQASITLTVPIGSDLVKAHAVMGGWWAQIVAQGPPGHVQTAQTCLAGCLVTGALALLLAWGSKWEPMGRGQMGSLEPHVVAGGKAREWDGRVLSLILQQPRSVILEPPASHF